MNCTAVRRLSPIAMIFVLLALPRTSGAGDSHAGVGVLPHAQPVQVMRPRLDLGDFRDTGPGIPGGRFSTAFGSPSVLVDAAIAPDATGLSHGCFVPDASTSVSVPVYASYYGVSPGYYPVYYPTTKSSAAVTYTVPAAAVGTTAQQTIASVPPVQPVSPPQSQEQATPSMPYPATINAAVDALDANRSASNLMKRGALAFRARDYMMAGQAFLQAIPLDADNALPRFTFAHALFALGDYENAAYNIRRGLDLMPEWVTSGNNLAASYGYALDLQDQRAALASWVKLNPTDGEALTTLGYVDYFTGNVSGAQDAFTKLKALRPEDPIAPFFLTEIERVLLLQPKVSPAK